MIQNTIILIVVFCDFFQNFSVTNHFWLRESRSRNLQVIFSCFHVLERHKSTLNMLPHKMQRTDHAFNPQLEEGTDKTEEYRSTVETDENAHF